MKEKQLIFFTRDIDHGGEAVFIRLLNSHLKNFKNTFISVLGRKNRKDTTYLDEKVMLGEVIITKAAINKLKKLNLENKVILNFVFGLQSVGYLKHFSKKNSIISAFHTNITGRLSPHWPFQMLSKIICINFFNKHSSKLIFLTHAQKNEYRKLAWRKRTFDSKAVVINNFIEKEIIIKKEKIKRFTDLRILFVGRLKKSKGFDDLINLSSKLDKKNVQITAIGKGPLAKKLSRTSIHYLGEIDNPKILKEYDKNNILILPSYSETFGMVILEAMARGLVVLASNLPAINEYFINTRNGYLFRAGSITEMESIIEYLIKNPNKIKIISNNNLKDILKFTSEKKVLEYLKVYNEVTNKNAKK